MLIRVGHSPDPDDAFMFYALAAGKIDTGRYRFTHELVDIETLNRRAFSGELELTAVSVHAYAHLTDRYMLCTCGASMGDRYGPMLVARQPLPLADLTRGRIAVPGTLTTAYLALRLCLNADFTYAIVPFDEILDVVAAGQYQGQPIDAGLIIHEGQLTYARQNLQLVLDTGQWWFDATGLPLPLGANAVRKDLGPETLCDVQRLLRQHRVRLGPSPGGVGLRPALRPRFGSQQGRPVRGHVRERLDAGFRSPRSRGRAATVGPRSRRRRDSPAIVPEFVGDA